MSVGRPQAPAVSATPARPRGEDTFWATRIVEESVSVDGMMRALVINDASVQHYEVIVATTIRPMIEASAKAAPPTLYFGDFTL